MELANAVVRRLPGLGGAGIVSRQDIQNNTAREFFLFFFVPVRFSNLDAQHWIIYSAYL